MSAVVEQQILVKIKALVEGLSQVQVLASSVQNLNKGGSGFKRIEQDANSASKSVAGLSFRVKDTEKSLLGIAVKGEGAASVLLSGAAAAGTFGAALVALGAGAAALGFGAFVAEGIRFNSVIESAKIGIATIVANTYDVRDAQGKLLSPVESFNAALDKSEELERGLQKAAIETKFEFEDVLGFFNSTVISSAGLKTNLEQLVKITQDFSLAAGAANIDVEKVRTGIQQIFTGGVTVRNPLARVLFPGETTKQINDQLKKYREAGTLVDFVEGKLQVFRLSADQVAQSFEAVANNTTDAFKLFAAQSTLPLFDKIKETLGFIINQVVDLNGVSVKLQPTFQKIADILDIILGFVGDELLSATKYVFDQLGGWVDYLDENKDQLDEILPAVASIAENILGMVGDTASVAADTYEAAESTRTWSDTIKYVALFVALIRDILNVIIGSVESLIGGIGTGLLGALNSVADAGRGLNDILANTVELFDAVWAKKIRDAKGVGNLPGTDFVGSLLQSGQNRFDNGLNLTNFDQTINDLNAKRTPRAPRPKRTPSTFNSRPGTGAAGDAGAAARAAKERLRAAQQLFDAIEKLQISNAKREVELNKLSNEQILKGYQRRYDQGLISAQEFYDKQKELELDNLDREQKSLEKSKTFARQALSRDLGALQGTFQLTEDQLTALESKLASLNPDDLANADAKTIKQATEYTKYLEQTAQIEGDLNKVVLKRADTIATSTEHIKDQSREYRQQVSDIKGELSSTIGEDGVSEFNALKKRIANELPKILTESNQGVPGIEQVATAIRDLGTTDISGVREQFTKFNIDIDSLSEDTQTLLRLFDALGTSIKLNAIQSAAGKIRNRAEFDADGVSTAFDNGSVNLDSALSTNVAIQAQAVTNLTDKYNQLKAILDQVQAGGGIIDPTQVQAAEALGRAIEAIKNDFGALSLVQKQADRDATIFQSKLDAIDIKRQSGAINTKAAREQVKAVQLEQIAALELELTRLEALDQKLPDVAAKVAAVRNEIGTLHNDVDSEFIKTAQSINGTIGDAFSTFLTNIQDGTQSIGDSFRQLVSGLLLGIAKAIAQALLLQLILKPLGLTGDDSGGIGGFLSGLIGGGKADGGFISGGGTSVSDSILTPLSHGEAVIPVNAVKRYGRGMISSIINGSFLPISRFGYAIGGFGGDRPGAGGGNGRGAVRIINTLDPNLVKEFMSSAQGEEIILNVIGNNPGLLQRLA